MKRILCSLIMTALLCGSIAAQSEYSAELVKQAEAGDSNSQYILGYCYEVGDGVKQDYVKAFEWYTKAAAAGSDDAELYLAYCYYYGKGTNVDYDKAYALFKKSSTKGYYEAMVHLGYCHYYGLSVKQNYAMAVEYFKFAAEEDDPEAQFLLGDCYYNGVGVEQDYKESVRWMKKAAEQGHGNAQNCLGYAYLKGEGVPVDMDLAYKWIKKSVDQNNSTAFGSLGEYYYIKKDYSNSAICYQRCLKDGGMMEYADYARWKEVKRFLRNVDDSYPAAIVEKYVDCLNRMLKNNDLSERDNAEKLLGFTQDGVRVNCRIDDAVSKLLREEQGGVGDIMPKTYLSYIYAKNKKTPISVEIRNILPAGDNILYVEMIFNGLTDKFASSFYVRGDGIGYISEDNANYKLK